MKRMPVHSSALKVVFVIAVSIAGFDGLLFAKTPDDQPKMERTGGDYPLVEITTRCQSAVRPTCFRIVFDALNKTGRFDRLVLESGHVNVGVKPGDKVRLSAEIAVDRGRTAEVSQVVLFGGIPGSQVPVWMLSSKHRAGPGPAARYIEMHAPQTDFLVL